MELNKIDELIYRFKTLYKSFLFKEAEIVLNELNHRYPSNHLVKTLNADWAYFQKEYELADQLYDDLLKENPQNSEILKAKAQIALDLNHLEEADDLINLAINCNNNHVDCLLLKANIHYRKKELKTFSDLIDSGLEKEPQHSLLLSAKGMYYCIHLQQVKIGANYLNQAIKHNPLNIQAHLLLGRGYSPVNYEDNTEWSDRLQEADKLLKKNQYKKAKILLKREYQKNKQDINTLRLFAASEFHLNNFRKCIELSFEILSIKANYGLAHYYIAESLIHLKDQFNVIIKQRKELFDQKESPLSIPFLKELFINYDQCDDTLKKLIRISLQPFSQLMEALTISGATVYFKDLHHLLSECPFLKYLKNTRSIDLRLADDLGGQGGYHMSSEKLQQKKACYGGYNVAFHEFGHLIHWLMTDTQNDQLKQLFINAKKTHRILDLYSSQNVREYFAQGIEAYISDYKFPDETDAFKNTHSLLLEKDPDFILFLESFLHQTSFQDNVVKAYILKSQFLDTNLEALDLLNKTLELYPDNGDILTEIGIIYRDIDLNKAIMIHQDILTKNPLHKPATIALAYELFLQNSEVNLSIDLLQNLQIKMSKDAEILHYMGFYYLVKKDFPQAILYLNQSISLDPYPDPYQLSIEDPFHLLGKSDSSIGDYTQAIENYQKSLKINANNIDLLNNLAYAFLKLDKFEEAENTLKSALALNPVNPESLALLEKLKKR